MKRFAKLLSLRLNKFYIVALIIAALQLLISVILEVSMIDKFSIQLDDFAINNANNTISPQNFSIIMAVVAAVFVAVLVMHYNNPRFYLHLNIQKTKNVELSCASSLIMSVWVAMVYLISSVISAGIIIGIHSDYAIINSVYATFNFAQVFRDFLVIFLACSCLCAAAMAMRMIYERSKLIAILLVGLIVILISLYYFGDLLPQKLSEYLSTFGGSATILAIINVLAFGGYALGEILGEVKR